MSDIVFIFALKIMFIWALSGDLSYILALRGDTGKFM